MQRLGPKPTAFTDKRQKKTLDPEIGGMCATLKRELENAIDGAAKSARNIGSNVARYVQYAFKWLDQHSIKAIPTDKDGAFYRTC